MHGNPLKAVKNGTPSRVLEAEKPGAPRKEITKTSSVHFPMIIKLVKKNHEWKDKTLIELGNGQAYLFTTTADRMGVGIASFNSTKQSVIY